MFHLILVVSVTMFQDIMVIHSDLISVDTIIGIFISKNNNTSDMSIINWNLWQKFFCKDNIIVTKKFTDWRKDIKW